MHHLKHVLVVAALSASMVPAFANVITLDGEGIGNLSCFTLAIVDPNDDASVGIANEPSTQTFMVLLDSASGSRAGAYRNCTSVSISVADAAHSISLVATDDDRDIGGAEGSVVPRPEPSATPMLAAGLAAIGLAARQRRTGWRG